MKTNIKTLLIGSALLLPLIASCGGVDYAAAMAELKTAGEAFYGSDAVRFESNGTVTAAIDVPVFQVESDGSVTKTEYGASLTNGKLDLKLSGLTSESINDLKASLTVKGTVGASLGDQTIAYNNQTMAAYVNESNVYLDLSSASLVHLLVEGIVSAYGIELPEKAFFDATSYLEEISISSLHTYLLESFDGIYGVMDEAREAGSSKLSISTEGSSTVISYYPDIDDLWPVEYEDEFHLRDYLSVDEGSVMTYTVSGGAITGVGYQISTTLDEEGYIEYQTNRGMALSQFPGLDLEVRGVFLTSMGSAVSVSFPDFADYTEITIPSEA